MKVVRIISSRLLLVLLVKLGLCLPVLANPVDSLYVLYQNRDGGCPDIITIKFAVLRHFVYVCTNKTNIATRYEF